MTSIPGNTPRTLLLALAFFGGFALLGWIDGVFERLGPAACGALALFAAAFAAAACLLDADLRGFVARARRLRKAPGKSPGARPAAT